MYEKMFQLINNELNFLHDKRLELKKIEIKGIKIKLVYLDRQLMEVKVRNYEIDYFSPEPKLVFKREYVKEYNDKYFR
jgi:hypothetical protein